MSDAIKHITDNIFFFKEDSALVHMHCAYNAVQLLRRSRLSWTMLPNIPELNALIIRFRESYISVIWVASQKDRRSQGATGWILAMQCYNILVKTMRFSCFPVLPGTAEALIIWGGTVKRLLIAYFISNISGKKNIKMRSHISKL